MTIASEISRLQTAKADIKTAIEAKWVTVPSSAKVDTYDGYIAQIEWPYDFEYPNLSVLRWPCPAWFHVDSYYDWDLTNGIKSALWKSSSLTLEECWTYAHLPAAWYRNVTSSISSQWTKWYYGSYSPGSFYNVPSWSWSYWSGSWFSIRPIKNQFIEPDIFWKRLSRTNNNKYICYSPYLWLISIKWWTKPVWSSAAQCITISDKNCWATTVYNYWDTLSEANCWKYYQGWNNYWFPWTWTITDKITIWQDWLIFAAWFAPWSYSSSTWIYCTYWNWPRYDASYWCRTRWYWIEETRRKIKVPDSQYRPITYARIIWASSLKYAISYLTLYTSYYQFLDYTWHIWHWRYENCLMNSGWTEPQTWSWSTDCVYYNEDNWNCETKSVLLPYEAIKEMALNEAENRDDFDTWFDSIIEFLNRHPAEYYNMFNDAWNITTTMGYNNLIKSIYIDYNPQGEAHKYKRIQYDQTNNIWQNRVYQLIY